MNLIRRDGRKPDTKEYMLCDSTCLRFQNKQIYRQKVYQWLLGVRSRGETDWEVSQSVQSLNRNSATPQTAAHQASLSITNSQSLLKLMSVKSEMPYNHLILCHPLLLPTSIFPSIRVFSSESLPPIRWPKYWSFSVSISLSNEYSGLIYLKIHWLDLLVVQGTLKSLLQQFFGVQLSLYSNSHIHT